MQEEVRIVGIRHPIETGIDLPLQEWIKSRWPAILCACPNGWAILQSHTELRFCRVRDFPAPVPNDGGADHWLASVFEGRVFDGRQEIRWTNDGAQVNQWTIQEVSIAPGAPKYERRSVRYYLWGVWTGGGSWFVEGRLTGPQQYPVETNGLQKDDRAFVSAYEYRQQRPETESCSLQEWTRFLNRSPVEFSRLYAVGAGQDEEI